MFEQTLGPCPRDGVRFVQVGVGLGAARLTMGSRVGAGRRGRGAIAAALLAAAGSAGGVWGQAGAVQSGSVQSGSVQSGPVAAEAPMGPLAMRPEARALDTARPMEAVSVGSILERAGALLVDRQPVRASHLLQGLAKSELSVSMSDAEQARFFGLLRSATAAVAKADPVSVSLERAEIALLEDDLREAERQAMAVAGHPSAGPERVASAEAVVMMVKARRRALTAQMGARVAEAQAAFDAGGYVQAGVLVGRVMRSGVVPEGEAGAALSRLTARLVDLDPTLIEAGDPLSLAVLARAGSAGAGLNVAETAAAEGVEAGAPPERGVDWLLSPPGERQAGAGEALVVALAVGQPDAGAQPVGQPVDAPPADQPPAGGGVVDQAVRAEAQKLLEEADAAYQARRLGEAASKYERVLEPLFRGLLTPEQVEQIERRLAEARGGLRVNPGREGGLIAAELNNRELARQRTQAEFENLVAQSTDALAQGDIDTARQLASQAQLILLQGRDVLSARAGAEFEAQVARLFSEIETQEERIRQDRAAQQSAELEAERRAAVARASQERDRRIRELLERIFALQNEQDYEGALQEVEQLLFIDPNNQAGKVAFNALRDVVILKRYQQARQDVNRGIAREASQNIAALVAPPDIVNYPEDWIEISQRRTGAQEFVESAENRAVLATLEGTRTRVDFRDAPIEDVLTFVAQLGDVQVDIDWSSLNDIGVDPDAPVTLRLTNIPLSVALDRALEKVADSGAPAGWAVRDGVLTVASDEVLRRDRVLQIYDIRDLVFEFRDAENPPQFDLNTIFSQGGQGGGGGGQSPFQNQQQNRDVFDRDELITRIIEIIESNIDPLGWETAGGQTGTIEEYNQSVLIVTNTPANHRAITGLLRELRRIRNLQINVEARFLTVSENFFEQIGFDIDVFFGGTSNEFQNAQLLDPTLALSDFFDEGGTSLLEDVTGQSGFDADGNGTIDAAEQTAQPRFEPGTQGDQFSPVSSAQGSFDIVQELNESAFAASLLGLSPALGVAGRFLDDVQVDFILQATQADTRSVTLNAPRLTFTNGQRSYIAVGTQFSFVSQATPVVSTSSVAFAPTIAVVAEGAVLDVLGVVSADRRYVTIEIRISLGDVSFESSDGQPLATDVQGVAGGTAGTVGGGIATATIQTPTVVGTSIETTVTIPDQGTILLGGQRLVSEFATEAGVPVLSKLPIINRFFSNRLEATEEQTLLVLLKPTILIQNEEEERNFPGLLDSIGQ